MSCFKYVWKPDGLQSSSVRNNNSWNIRFHLHNGSWTHSTCCLSLCESQLVQTSNLSQIISMVTCIEKCQGHHVVFRNCFFSHVRELHWPFLFWIIQSCTRTLSCFSFFFLTPSLKTPSKAASFMLHQGFDTVSIAFVDWLLCPSKYCGHGGGSE